MTLTLGRPRLHLRVADSTNDRARALAAAGAPHGTLVTAGEQSSGHGRQGRTWSAPPGRALLMSLVLREYPRLLPLAAALAVADVAGHATTIKWPNDVLLGERKLAGVLVEGRPQAGWAVLGIGVNVAVRPEDLPPELRKRAASLELPPAAVEPTLSALLSALERRLAEDDAVTVHDLRARDALHGLRIDWGRGHGVAAGIDDEGRLLVDHEDGTRSALDAGEVHLAPLATP
jgi:BirA family transcriptional regulator, biotin operon repressor / biotin---[acetyl-CoA-carboxylase] ligase